MTALRRKLLRDLSGSGGLLVAIAAIMAVGVSCYVSMSAAHANLSQAQREYYARCRMADFQIDLKKAPLDALKPLASMPGVRIRPRIESRLTIDLPGVQKPINGQVYSLPLQRRSVINDIVVTRGSYFTGLHGAEVIVNDAFAKQHRLYPGSKLTVLLNNRRQELVVVGTAISSEFVYVMAPGGLIPDPDNYGILYLSDDYMEEVFDFDGACNQVVGTLSPDLRQQVQRFLDHAELMLADYGVFTTVPRSEQPSHQFLENEIEQLWVFAVLLPGIFLAVAAAVLNLLLGRLIEQQRTIIGTLKALGYSNWHLLLHYLQFGLVVGLIGGLFGCVLGYLLAGTFTSLYRTFFEFPSLNNDLQPSVFAIGMLISLLCALAGTAYSTRKMLKLEPAEAMRPKPPRQGGAILLERLPWLWNRLDTGWRMVLRNVFRNRVRTLVGVFAAAMGTTLVANGLLANQSLFYLLDFQFEKVLLSDIDLVFKDEQNRSALYEVKRMPGVDAAEPTLQVACTFRSGHHRKRAGITGLIPESQLTVPRDRQGRAVRIPSAGLVMGRALAERLHVQAGDTVTIRPIKGLRRRHQVQVVSVADGYLGLSCYANLQYLSRLIGEEDVLTGVQLKVNPDQRVRREFYRQLKQLPGVAGYSSRDEVVSNLMDTLLETNLAAVGVIIAFAGALFFGSTYNAATIALTERQREVATMLVLGYTPQAISRLFWRESFVVQMTGTLLGMPLGYLLLIYVAETAANEIARLPLVAPPIVWVWVLGVSFLFSLVSHLVVRRRIYQLHWQESLQVKE